MRDVLHPNHSCIYHHCGVVSKEISGDLKNITENLQPTQKLDCIQCNDCDCMENEDGNKIKEDRVSDPILCAARLKHGKTIRITPEFSLAELHSILDLLSVKCYGVTHPDLHCGTQHSTFAASIEKCSLWSISFLHYGHCRLW
jgi:hypothetical protein